MKKTLMLTFVLVVLAAQGLSCTADNPGAEKPTTTGDAGGATGGGGGGGGGGAQQPGERGMAAAQRPGERGMAAAQRPGELGDGGGAATGGAGGTGGSGDANASTGPCDLYASGGTPCVAAHSTVRALFGAYTGKLYQVRRASDNTTKDISVLKAGGPADSAPQDAFCAGTSCVITVLYDQSGHGNDLWYQGSDVVPGSPRSSPAKATTESLQVSGSKVYSLYINPGNSYWRDGHTTGVPTGSAPEGLYMVTSGTHVNGGCCFDYGNSETTRKADRAGAMDAINFSKQCWFGGCSGTGPWVQADLEWGLFPGGSSSWNPNPKGVSAQVRHCDPEERRDDALRAEGRRRPVGQSDQALRGLAAAQL